jgi:hypothetical protein
MRGDHPHTHTSSVLATNRDSNDNRFEYCLASISVALTCLAHLQVQLIRHGSCLRMVKVTLENSVTTVSTVSCNPCVPGKTRRSTLLKLASMLGCGVKPRSTTLGRTVTSRSGVLHSWKTQVVLESTEHVALQAGHATRLNIAVHRASKPGAKLQEKRPCKETALS